MTEQEHGDRIPLSDKIRKLYAGRIEHNRSLHQELENRSRRLSLVRMIIALGIAALLFLGLWDLSNVEIWPLGLCGLSICAFFLVARLHDNVIRAARRHRTLVEINEEAALRLERKWDRLPAPVVPSDQADHPVARDLDLFHREENRASLLRLLGLPRTPNGRSVLVEWLLEPADPDTIRERQKAVGELAPLLDWRQEMELAGRGLPAVAHDMEPFLKWAEGRPWLSGRGWLVWTARVVPLITFALLGLNIAGFLTAAPWIVLALVSLIFCRAVGGRIKSILVRVDWSSRAFGVYANLFRLVGEAPLVSGTLSSLKESMEAEGVSAHRQMERLDKFNGYAEARYYMIHFLLEAFFFWDVHVLCALEGWQRRAGRRARGWLRALGEIETLCVLAGLERDHPDWALPEILDDGDTRLEAMGIGHPLLHPDACVVNDVTIGPSGSFLLITGSNMSGKSTLLRALGMNAVLAQAGGPVCARSFRMSSLAIGTSFRIHDVLEDGVSYFMAELQRIKEIVSLARDQSEDGDRTVLYLFDEILLGTNVSERQVAVKRVIGHLLEQGAIGAIATHDLSLADAQELSEACRPFHFSESYEEIGEGSKMVFDYKLKEGVAPTTNALKLLELVGIT
ncbi:MAG TPA: hypothetical protein VM425_19840 [Myxococcota bacterium]|nr:hypothetical protein [Myxococcota bacterium]